MTQKLTFVSKTYLFPLKIKLIFKEVNKYVVLSRFRFQAGSFSIIIPFLTDMYTANVCMDFQGLCGEIGVRGCQIYRDCMYTRNPCNF